MKQLFATKSLAALQAEAEHGSGLKRSLGAMDLLFLGVGGVVGTGIFVLTGHAASANAGPAVTIAFLVSAFAATLAGLCYAEMASMIPLAGSAYTYAYATLGELIAFIIGWDLILEYGVAAATVSVGWSGYVTALVHHLTGWAMPHEWTSSPLAFNTELGAFERTDAMMNVPAMLILVVVALVLARGVRLSLRVISYVVVIKLAVILLFIVAAAPFVNPANWHPFIPPNTGHFGSFGVSGLLQAATMLFFAYGGFDSVSTAAQECRHPQRDVPIGMIGSIAVATVLYVAVSLVLTGVVPYHQLAVADPMAEGMAATGQAWMATVVECGAVAGLSSVLLVQVYGQTRILFAMAADGLLPKRLHAVHPRYGTPATLTLWIGGLAALAGGVLPIELLGELTSIGTLFAFVLVSLGVLVLRLRHPDAPRPFRVPGGPFVLPIASALVSGALVFTATPESLIRLVVWMIVGLGVYLTYGQRHSKLRSQ